MITRGTSYHLFIMFRHYVGVRRNNIATVSSTRKKLVYIICESICYRCYPVCMLPMGIVILIHSEGSEIYLCNEVEQYLLKYNFHF